MKFLCPNCKAKYQIGPEKLVGRRIAKIRCRKCDYRIQIAPRAGSEEYDITATPNSMAPNPSAAPGHHLGGSAVAAGIAAPVAHALPNPQVPAPKPVPLAGAATPRIPMPGAPGARALATPRARAADKDDSSVAAGTRKPTAAVPGLPGLGASKLTRSAGARTDLFGAASPLGARRPVAAPPGPAVASAALTPAAAPAAVPLPAPPPVVAPLALAPEAQPLVPAPSLGSPLAAPAVASNGVSAAGAAAMAAPAPAIAPAASAIAPPPSPVPARPAAGGTQLGDQFRQSVQAGGAGAVVEDGPQDGWFVGVNGVPLGPIPVGDLRELASAGHIDRKSLVWREGQAEWRPLGKFPFLARILDDGGASSALRPASPEPAESGSTTARNSAANGQTVTGFDARPVETRGDRPSAWGDLDEEEDEQEQPTTVKGRVSVPPPPQGRVSAPGAAPLGLPGLPPAPPPPVPKVEVPLSPGQGPASSTAAVSVPPSASEIGPALAAVNALPVGDDAEAKMLRGKGRNKTLLMALAAAAAVGIGAVAWHLLSAPPAKNPTPPAHALAATSEQEKKPEPAPPPPETPPPAVETPPAATESPPGAPAIAQIPESPPTVKSAPTAAPPAATAEPSPKPASSLLSGLNTLQTPGPAPGLKTPGAGAGTGPGLEATAIQRTVRKYSPAVRQNCWQRALNARAPGVPSSAKVTATITVDSSGHVQSVTATGAPRGYPGLAHCIEEAVKGWSFPRSLGETVTNVPFMFVGQ
jgi:predicted Zn finger-like uncharacterized protein